MTTAYMLGSSLSSLISRCGWDEGGAFGAGLA